MFRTPHLTATLILLAYAASIALWLADVGGVLPYRSSLGFLGFVGILVFGCGVLLWALLSWRSRRRWAVVVPALLLGMLSVTEAPGPLIRMSDARLLRRRDLSEFAARVHGYGRITAMVEDERETHSLNGTVVRRSRAGLDSVRSWLTVGSESALLAEVLARDSIHPAVHEEFRRHLRRFGLSTVSVKGGYVHFRRDREKWFVWASPGARPLRPGEKVPDSGQVVSRRIGRWHVCHWPDDLS